MKQIVDLDQEDIENALREWCVVKYGRIAKELSVTPEVAMLGYGMGEHQGAVVSARIVLGDRADPQR